MIEAMPLIFFGTVLLLLLLGFPVAFTLGGVSVLFGVFTFGFTFFNLLPLRIWSIMTNPVLIAVPLFIYMGMMLEKAGLARDLLETMALLFGRLRGGLAISVVVVGVLLAASTGIVGATVVTMGLLSLPTMLKRGYNVPLATGTISASGTLGQIIPPSIVLVLLGSTMNISVGDLFIGAIFPGLILVTLYLAWIISVSIFKPSFAPAMPAEELAEFRGKGMVRKIFKAFVMPFFLVVAVLGSILAGIASPTEAAAVGALGAMLLTMLYKKFNLETLRTVMRETTYLTSMVFAILIGATTFGLVFRGLNGDLYLTNLITEANLTSGVFLGLVMVVVFVAGFFIDFIEIIFIIVPVVMPVFREMNVDFLWLGILLAMNLQTSFLTPPFGFALFYLKGVAPPQVTTGQLYKGIIPFVIIQIIGLAIVLSFPEIAIWLPKFLLD